MSNTALVQNRINEMALAENQLIEMNRNKAVYRNRLRREKESFQKALDQVNNEISRVDIFSPEYNELLTQQKLLQEQMEDIVQTMGEVDFRFNTQSSQIMSSIENKLRKTQDIETKVRKTVDSIKTLGTAVKTLRFGAIVANPIFWIAVIFILVVLLLIVIKVVNDNPTEALSNFCSNHPNCLEDIRKATDGSLLQRVE